MQVEQLAIHSLSTPHRNLEEALDAYVLEMQRWIEDLRDERLTGPDAWDGYVSLLAAEGCIASLHSGAKGALYKSP